jgi:hypothetical protein
MKSCTKGLRASVCELEKIILLRKTCRLLTPPPLYSHSPSSVKNESTKAGEKATKEPRAHIIIASDKNEVALPTADLSLSQTRLMKMSPRIIYCVLLCQIHFALSLGERVSLCRDAFCPDR